jgi:polygalacturonase
MVHGSEGAVIENNDVVSGDDSFCTFPSADPSDPLFNRPIRNVLFQNNKGVSTHARAYGGGLHIRWTGTSYPRLSTTIENITVRGLTGEVVNAGAAGLAILNRTTGGTVRNITFEDVHIVKTNKVTLGLQVMGDNGGSISNVTISGSSFTGTCGNAALSLRKVIGATIRDSRFVAQPGCRLAGLASESSGISVINTVFNGKRQGL